MKENKLIEKLEKRIPVM